MTKRRSTSGALPLLALLFVSGSAASRRGLSLTQLRSLAARSGFPDPELAAAVAMAESGGNVFAVGDWGRSHGLWQIHLPAHPQYRFVNLFSAETNARAAFEISKGGTDWSPWTTFRNGDYRRWMGAKS